MYVDAVGTLPPVGMSMLSVKRMPPDFAIPHFTFGSLSRKMSPDHAMLAARSPFASMISPSVSPIEFHTPTLPFSFGSVRSCVTVVTGPVTSWFHAMPSMPENHGSVYSRFGSNGGLACVEMRFEKFGMRLLSSFSAQPLLR